MPTYVYEVIEPDGSRGERFEVDQRMTDPLLEHHPESGRPVRRVILPARILGPNSDARMTAQVSDDKKLDQLGFTKYVKAGDGYYERRAGQGPDVISADKPVPPS